MDETVKSNNRSADERDLMQRSIADWELQEATYQRVVEDLALAEAKFRKFTEQSVVGVYLIQDDIFRYVNPELARLIGYHVRELVDRLGPRHLVHPEDWPEVDEQLRAQGLARPNAVHAQFRCIRKDGSVIHVEAYGSRTEHDGRSAVIGTLLDVSDRVLAKAELETELTKFQALYDLAVAMTTLRSLNENLELLVEKSRQLLHADKAYLALRDPEADDLFMHTLSGITTPSFKDIRIPMGRGLGGMVAETGRWYIVEDYLQEIEPMFHEIVRAEGLVSGIAVPVKTGSTNVGVLTVFNSKKRGFSKSDLDTLSLLGNLAALEITRRHYQEQFRVSRRSYRILYEESKKREELYVSLLNSSADAIVIYDVEGRTQYVNPAFTRIFGWSLSDVEGQRIPFLPETEREASMRIIQGLLTSGTPRSGFETKRLTRDGRILEVSISASRCHDHEGKPIALLVILRDITERKRVQEELRKSKERYQELYEEAERRGQLYRTLLDVSPEPIVVYDVDGRPTYLNPAFTRVFGWTFDELEGHRIDFVPPENISETREMIETVLSGKNFSSRETRRFTKDGRVIDVIVSGAVFPGKDGRPTGSVVHLQDITDRKAAERKLATELKKFQGLYDLALAMTGEHTLDENLVFVVNKSRELLDADMALIALRDGPSGDLCMHTVSGVRTEAFTTLRIPFGRGLGGRVAETGQWYIVADYLDEIEPVFHDIVREEGIVAGIAVPVKIAQTNVGVLYAFNRRKTDFSKSDLDTLSLLGNLAAVEITRKLALDRLHESHESFRKLYEESRRREELYLSLLNSSADAIVVYDMGGLVQYLNPSFTRIFGWTMDELSGIRIPFMPEQEAEASLGIILDLIKNGTPCSGFETRRYTKDGRLLDVSISASRCHDHEGSPAGMLVILRDISDRKRAEKNLRESEERFRTLAEVAPIGLVILAADHNTEYINPKFTETFGFTIEDLPDAESWFSKVYPDMRSGEKAQAIWQSETAEIKAGYGIGREADPRVFTARCKNGEEKSVSLRAVVLPEGRVIATFLDVTRDVKAQREILRAKDEWERTFNAVSDLIMILDDRNRIVRANKALARRLDLDPDALVGMGCSEIFGGESIPASFCPDPETLTYGGDHSVELTAEALGGVFDLRVSPLRDEQGQHLGAVHVARDVTALKSMERARRLAVHHLAHEIKTPLAVIKGSLNDLDREDLSSTARIAKVERIRRNIDRLADIQHVVQGIVSPRRYLPERFPLNPTTLAILEEMRQRSPHRLVTLLPQLEPIETDAIDPEIFRDVLTTLVKNAVENAPDEGEIVIVMRRVTGGILLQVRDRGVGILAGDRDFVFEAFHHTQETERYATRNPFDFNAGGKGLELMRLKILSEEGNFQISFDSWRCRHIPTNVHHCPGRISSCPHVNQPEECRQSGGTTFSVLFHERPRVEGGTGGD